MIIPWVFSVVYAAVIGAIFRKEPDTIYRPSPVCLSLSQVSTGTDTIPSHPVLVLDWQELSNPSPLWGLRLDVDLAFRLDFTIYPFVLLGSRKHHDRGQILELQHPQAKESSR